VEVLSRLKLKRRSTISGCREYTLTKEAQGASIRRLSSGTAGSSDRDLLWENGGSAEKISAASLRKERKHRARADREREMERERELKSKDERERQKNKPERRDNKQRSKTEKERPKTGILDPWFSFCNMILRLVCRKEDNERRSDHPIRQQPTRQYQNC
jgi:hypothetical protein